MAKVGKKEEFLHISPDELHEGYRLAGEKLELHLNRRHGDPAFQTLLNTLVQACQLSRPDLYIVGTAGELRCLTAEEALADNIARAAKAQRASLTAARKFQAIRKDKLPEAMHATHDSLGSFHESSTFDSFAKMRKLKLMAVLRLGPSELEDPPADE